MDFWEKIGFLERYQIFGKYLDFWKKNYFFGFLEKIWIFGEKNWIFGEKNSDFWNFFFGFLEIFWIFAKSFGFFTFHVGRPETLTDWKSESVTYLRTDMGRS